MTATGGPAGHPIGRALQIAPGLVNDDLRDAVSVVARIHGDGDLPAIPLLWTRGIEARGRFLFRGSQPIAILINHAAAFRHLSVFHEIGHLLDFSGAGLGRGFASASSRLFVDWLTSVADSVAFSQLDKSVERGLALIPRDLTEVGRLLRELQRAEELWARCYAQYIARQSNRADLIEGIAALRVGEIAGVTVPLQWDDDDFDAIEREIERLMRRLGWRSR